MSGADIAILVMRRADRLFQIIQHLHHQRTITAQALAEALEVSTRTIYRDIQDLSLSGVPITGETGQGYRLLRGFQLPPLMFTAEELEALLLGARMVRAWTDKGMAKAANQALQKNQHIIPERLKPELERKDMIVPDFPKQGLAGDQLMLIRKAIKDQQKVHFSYTREDNQPSVRTIHPLGLFYWGKVWTVVGWCELRDSFRHFRLDRMTTLENSGEYFEFIQGRMLQDYLCNECGL